MSPKKATKKREIGKIREEYTGISGEEVSNAGEGTGGRGDVVEREEGPSSVENREEEAVVASTAGEERSRWSGRNERNRKVSSGSRARWHRLLRSDG